MTVYEYKVNERLPIGSCSVAIGFFDGVHLAHRELICDAIREARRLGVAAGVVTFLSESAIKPKNPRIYSSEEKLEIIASLGVDFAVVCRFEEVSSMTGEEFVREVLVSSIGAVSVSAGFNFRFGVRASSDARDLCDYMSRLGGRASILPAFVFRGAPLSSTVIRSLLAEGDVETAGEALGLPFFVTARVERGERLGRRLGFPTANLPERDGFVRLKKGVYRCALLIDGRAYSAITNVGVCPTFDERESHIEAHIIGFSGDIYGRELRLFFLGRLRDEMQFSSPEALTEQIETDKQRTIKENGDLLWLETGLS